MRLFLMTVALLFTVDVIAIEVIYDNKKTRSLQPYYERAKIKVPVFHNVNISSVKLKNPAKMIKEIVTDDFPISNEKLSLGKVLKRQVELKHFQRPACLVGDDNISRKWLTQRYRILAQHDAICFVVQVDSLAKFLQFKKRYPKLTFVPDNGATFVSSLGVRHYPVAISKRYIEQ